MGKILMLPGDGIGTEVMAEVRRIIDWFGTQRGFDVTIDDARSVVQKVKVKGRLSAQCYSFEQSKGVSA